MPDIHIVPAAAVERWRRQAKELRKQNAIPHYAALDAVARRTGVFRDWHHVIVEAKATEPAEQAFKAGLVIGVDIKDAGSGGAAKRLDFREDERISSFVLEEFKALDPERWAEEEEVIAFSCDVVFYRWQGALPNTLDEALRLTNKGFFFGPQYVRLRGKRLFDVLSDEDEDV